MNFLVTHSMRQGGTKGQNLVQLLKLNFVFFHVNNLGRVLVRHHQLFEF